ncbi:MAG: hypothetical protein AAGF12_27225 [Myxococcota bacterium]
MRSQDDQGWSSLATPFAFVFFTVILVSAFSGNFILVGALVGGAVTISVAIVVGSRFQQVRHRAKLRAKSFEHGRALVLVLPAQTRPELNPWVDAVNQRGDVESLDALRDAVANRASALAFADVEMWCGPPDEFDPWVEALLGATRNEPQPDRGFRDIVQGFVVLLIAVRHTCELPDLASPTEVETVRQALLNSVPTHSDWLTAAVARWEPDGIDASINANEIHRIRPTMADLRRSDDRTAHE